MLSVRILVAVAGLLPLAVAAQFTLPPYRPTPIESQADAMRRAAELKEAQAKAAAAAAEARLAEARAREAERKEAEAAAKQSGRERPADPPPYVKEWLKVATPRMDRYPDFRQVVFSDGPQITPDMIRLMTGSPLAADIAYYLATNRAEAALVSKMSLLDAARAIDRLERELKGKVPP